MKKLTALLLIIAALSALLSCRGAGGGTPSETEKAAAGPSPTTTEQGDSETCLPTQALPIIPADAGDSLVYNMSSENVSIAASTIFETPYGLYFLCWDRDHGFIYFSDKEYKDWMPLCGRPECFHNDENCSAYIDYPSQRIWLYGDHIYYAVFSQSIDQYTDDNYVELRRLKLDGSDHETYMRIDLEHYKSYSYSWYFHNKYFVLLFSGGNELISEGFYKEEPHYYIAELGADRPEAVPLAGEMMEIPGHSGFLLAGEGDCLYGVWYDVDNDVGTYVRKTNLAEQTIETLCMIPFYPNYGKVIGGKVLLYGCYPAWGIALVDAVTGETEYLLNEAPEERHWFLADDRWLIGAGTGENGEYKGTRIYDHEYNLVQELPYESYNKDIYVSLITDSFVFGFESLNGSGFDLDEHPPVWYLNLSDIGTENLMWRRWEPES